MVSGEPTASTDAKRPKLEQLAEIEGFPSVDAMIEAAATDSVCPAICTAEGCDYTAEMEPDQREGWCEACGTNTVASALVLSGLI